MKQKEKVEFVQLSNFESKFEYKDHTFILKEGDRGFFGAGRSVGLWGANGLKRDFIVSIGWTKPCSQPDFKNDLIKGITTWDKIKEEAINYLDKLL